MRTRKPNVAMTTRTLRSVWVVVVVVGEGGCFVLCELAGETLSVLNHNGIDEALATTEIHLQLISYSFSHNALG
eukprot:m.6783 g.6783  ORF g.6783 m.6783 type:complete len:74 (+) comp5191_c0_seq1:224-445(+)